MFARIAGFEFRYQLRNPVFWISAAIFFLLVFASVTVDQVQIGGGGNVHKNSPQAIDATTQVMSLFFMFASTAFAAGALVRDDETRFGPIIRATRMTRADYVFGRFAGAFGVCLIVLAMVPLAIFAGSLMPWVDPDTLGPNRLHDYAFAYFVLGVPAAFFTAALFYALTTATRSMMWAYVGAVVLFLAYFIASAAVGRKPEYEHGFAWAEPFGTAAVRLATKYWTAAERNTLTPPLTGALLGGRLIWIGVGVAALAVAYTVFRFEARGSGKRGAEAVSDPAPVATGPLPTPNHAAARGAQFWARVRLEAAQVFRSPAYFVLLALGLINGGAGAWFAAEQFGTPIFPVTRVMIATLQGGFGLFAILIAIFYGGELVWRERDRRTHEIVDSAPIPDWALVLPKIVALSGVLVSTLAVSVLVALLVQTIKGYTHYRLDEYLHWYVLPSAFDWLLVAVLSVFVQSLVRSKALGWGIMLLYVISTLVFQSLGWEDNLYNYAQGPTVPLSDMNGRGRFWEGALWFRVYWGAFAALLMLFAFAMWRRGAETRLAPRFARLPRRLAGTTGAFAAVAALLFLGTGAWAYYNTHVLNEYRTGPLTEDLQADTEKTLLRFEHVPQPTVEAVTLVVDLQPHERRADVTGTYRLVNRTAAPIGDIHVRADRDTKILSLTIPGASVARAWPRFNYTILHLARPLGSGEATTLAFNTQRWQRGFRNGGNDAHIVDNGTFLNNFEFAPVIGMSREGLLTDRVKRRKHGLPAELRVAKLGDPAARAINELGQRGWTTSDITVVTDADQTPIAPGARVSDTTAKGRRTARFVTGAPIENFFSVQSARYAERHRRHGATDLTVYYDPQHPYNVDRMLAALGHGLDYYEANFGPYQFPYARIIEFPDYAQFAQAFAGTMPYSEGLGFITDFRDPEKIDFATYVTAHELGHQYWAHQIVGAQMQGATVLTETLAQYSALMVMEHLYGRDQIRRFLKYELDQYLRSRGTERIEEVPLERVENQGYIHYRKGSLVMYLLKDRMGEAAVNRALRHMLAQYKFKGAPFPMSTDLVTALRAEAAPDVQPLITDLFEAITLWDLKATDPRVTKRADGRYDVAFTVTARKLGADGQGHEHEVPLAEPIDIGLFTAEPGRRAFDSKAVVLMEKRPIHSGTQRLTFTVARAPTWVGVDPYNFHIDRNSDDNLAAVGSGA